MDCHSLLQRNFPTQGSKPGLLCCRQVLYCLSYHNVGSVKVAQSCPPLRPHRLQSMEFSRQNTGVGSRSLLQGIFPIQRSNPGFPQCGQILHQLSYQGTRSNQRLADSCPSGSEVVTAIFCKINPSRNRLES